MNIINYCCCQFFLKGEFCFNGVSFSCCVGWKWSIEGRSERSIPVSSGFKLQMDTFKTFSSRYFWFRKEVLLPFHLFSSCCGFFFSCLYCDSGNKRFEANFSEKQKHFLIISSFLQALCWRIWKSCFVSIPMRIVAAVSLT